MVYRRGVKTTDRDALLHDLKKNSILKKSRYYEEAKIASSYGTSRQNAARTKEQRVGNDCSFKLDRMANLPKNKKIIEEIDNLLDSIDPTIPE